MAGTAFDASDQQPRCRPATLLGSNLLQGRANIRKPLTTIL